MQVMDTELLKSMLEAGGTHVLEPRKYFIDAPLVANTHVVLRGSRGTRIEAVAEMPQMLTVNSQIHIEDVVFSGSAEPFGSPRFARDGLLLALAAFSTLKRVRVENCLRDGVHCGVGNNDSLLVEQCNFGGNGVVYGTSPQPHTLPHMRAPAPTAAASGNDIVCEVPQWVRPGCPVRIGTAKRVVVAVESGKITLNAAPPLDLSDWAIGVGCGWFEERSGDNNLCSFNLCLWRYNAEVGLACDGLYGHSVINGQFDFNAFFGVRIGLFGSNPVLGSTWIRPYFECNPSGSFLLGAAHDLVVTSPLHDSEARYEFVATSQVIKGVHLGSSQELLGAAASELPAKTLGDHWGGSKLDGPMRFNARAAAVVNGVLSAPAAMCLLPGGAVTSIATPGDSWWQKVTFVGSGAPTDFTTGPLLLVRGGSRTVTLHETIEFAHIGNGRWVEV